MFATFTLSTSPRGDQMALSTDCTTYWGKMPLVGWAQSAPLTCKRSSTSSLKDAIEFIQNNILYSLSLGIAPLIFFFIVQCCFIQGTGPHKEEVNRHRSTASSGNQMEGIGWKLKSKVLGKRAFDWLTSTDRVNPPHFFLSTVR